MAITGASGGIGQSLLARAIGRYRVRALFRSPSDLSKQCAERGCELVIGNLDEIRALDELVQEAEIVVHCAAKVIGFSRRDFVRVNIEGTRNLVERAVAAKVRRFVHLSSIAVYFGAEPCDAPFTEDLPLQEEAVSDSYAWSKLRAERIVADTFRNTATEFVILRPTFVYGPRIQSWTLLPLGLMEKNRSLFLGLDAGDGLLDPVHVEDVVEGILAAAETPGISGEIFNLGCEPATFREFYTALGGMIGKTPAAGLRADASADRQNCGTRTQALQQAVLADRERDRNSLEDVAQSANLSEFESQRGARVRTGIFAGYGHARDGIGAPRNQTFRQNRARHAKRRSALRFSSGGNDLSEDGRRDHTGGACSGPARAESQSHRFVAFLCADSRDGWGVHIAGGI